MRKIALTIFAVLALASCGVSGSDDTSNPQNLGSTSDERLSQWATSNMDIGIELGEAMVDIADGTEAYDLEAVRSACARLWRIVDDARDRGPIPDPAIQREWSAALDDFEDSSNYCVVGVDNLDPMAIDLAAEHMTMGGEHIETATRLLEG